MEEIFLQVDCDHRRKITAFWIYFTNSKWYEFISRYIEYYQELFKNGQPLVKYSTMINYYYNEEEKESSRSQ